ncbi:MAG: hypothetical protein K8R21_03130, partial [Leptospira sp.]|nr:hypothetical protein [Leptospira sp.]
VFRFFPRLTLEIDGVTHSLVNILNIDELQKIIEAETKLTTEIVTVQKGELFKKALVYFIPSIVALIMVFIPRFPVDKKYFFLILNLNAAFFANSLPVEKFPGKRKLILILVFVFLMQLFLLIR